MYVPTCADKVGRATRDVQGCPPSSDFELGQGKESGEKGVGIYDADAVYHQSSHGSKVITRWLLSLLIYDNRMVWNYSTIQ
jgi:hypothetical protein